jgi:hypothetical protein
MKRLALVAVMIILVMFGCGEDKKEEPAANREFQIPDSLLSPLDGYKLTKDDYHPVRGGIMETKELVMHYPASAVSRDVAVETMGKAIDAYRLIREEIGTPSDERVVMVGASDLAEYRFLTRKEWWYYGVVRGDTIYFEPFDILLKRTLLKMAVTQKMAQMALDRRSGGRIPLWMKEGIASRLAGEWQVLKEQRGEFAAGVYDLTPSPERIEEVLEAADDRPLTRIAFYCSYVMVDRLVTEFGMERIMAFIDLLAEGRDYDDASLDAFGVDYGSLLEMVRLKGEE